MPTEDGYPTWEDSRCDWEDHFDDMYPEFAPDPIVIRCNEAATELLAYFGPDGFGGDTAIFSKFCAEHSTMMRSGLEDDSQWPGKTKYAHLKADEVTTARILTAWAKHIDDTNKETI